MSPSQIKEKPRKVIGLMITKNESWILPTTLPQQLRFVDELLVLEGNSTDNTVQILKSVRLPGKKILVRKQTGKTANYSAWRQELLDWARERKATHIVCLDSDEVFTSNLLAQWDQLLANMTPGQTLLFDWITLWKSPTQFLTRGNVFAHLEKDFVFCDDGIASYISSSLHEARTPGNLRPAAGLIKKVDRSAGAVLHFQFVPFERVQMKQAFQRCRELVMGTDTPKAINYKYSESLDSPKVRTVAVPANWITGMRLAELSKSIAKISHDWFYDAILEYFSKHGILTFESLQIWQIPQLRSEFVKKLGREPRPQVYSSALKYVRAIIGRSIQILPRSWTAAVFVAGKKITRLLGL